MRSVNGKILVMVFMSFCILVFSAGHTLAGPNDLSISFATPQITSGVPADISIIAKNNQEHQVSFDRATIAYVNPDLTFKGPFEVTWPAKTLQPGSQVTVKAKITINTNLPSGSLVPLSVSLFYKKLSTGDPSCFRGTTMGAAKVQ